MSAGLRTPVTVCATEPTDLTTAMPAAWMKTAGRTTTTRRSRITIDAVISEVTNLEGVRHFFFLGAIFATQRSKSQALAFGLAERH
jgi:hypothetical protein